MYDNYFIVGIDTPNGQFTYHYHLKHWNMFDVKELDHALFGMVILAKMLYVFYI